MMLVMLRLRICDSMVSKSPNISHPTPTSMHTKIVHDTSCRCIDGSSRRARMAMLYWRRLCVSTCPSSSPPLLPPRLRLWNADSATSACRTQSLECASCSICTLHKSTGRNLPNGTVVRSTKSCSDLVTAGIVESGAVGRTPGRPGPGTG